MQETDPTPPVTLEQPLAGVALLRLQRPDKLNALDSRTIRELSGALARIAADDSLHAVVITGAGAAFCAGGDLQEILEIGAAPDWQPRVRALMASAAELVLQMRALPQPIIAAVNGPAVGGGMGLATAADIRLCSPSAYFSTAFVSLGLVGFEMGLSVLLPSILGSAAAFDLAVTGGRLDATQAARLNLVREVLPAEQLLERSLQLAGSIAARSPRAIRSTKAMLGNHLSLDYLRQALQTEMDAQMQCVFSPENRAVIAKIAKASAQ